MKETLEIKNFCGIKHLEIDLNEINLIIGPQASGKSIVAKLVFFFKRFFYTLANSIEKRELKGEFEIKLKEEFIRYFPENFWHIDDYDIKYSLNNYNININWQSSKLNISYPKKFDDFIKKYNDYYAKQGLIKNLKNVDVFFEHHNQIRGELHKELIEYLGIDPFPNIYFIPAGRTIFANIQQNIFSMLTLGNNLNFDPMIINFGNLYERIKSFHRKGFYQPERGENISNKINDLLLGNYISNNGDEFIQHFDGRKTDILHSSSGQQEILPMLLVLQFIYLAKIKKSIIFIEEPEAHLHPQAQKKIIELIAMVFTYSKSNFQFFITTHSPYILASFNNLIQAGEILKNEPKKKSKIIKIIPESQILDSKILNAFSLADGKIQNIKDKETNLISQTLLDSVSDDIAIQFDKLLDL